MIHVNETTFAELAARFNGQIEGLASKLVERLESVEVNTTTAI